jgi:hypothetical protein
VASNRIPTLDEPMARERPAQPEYLHVRTTPETFGAGAASSLYQGVGAAALPIAGIAEEERRKADDAKVDEALAAAHKAANDAYLTTKQATGQNAEFAWKGASEGLEKTQKSLFGGLENQNQRAAFSKRWSAIAEDTRVKALDHVYTQGEVAADAALAGRKASAKSAAVENALVLSGRDPVAMAKAQAPVEELVADLVERRRLKGVPRAAIDAEVSEFRASLVETTLKELLVGGNIERARGYLVANEGLLGDKASTLKEHIAVKEENRKAGAEAWNTADQFTTREGRFNTQGFEKAVRSKVAELGAGSEQAQRFQVAAERLGAERAAKWERSLDDIAARAVTKAVAAGYNLDAAAEEEALLKSGAYQGGVIWDNVRKRVVAAQHEGKGATPDEQSAYVDFLLDVSDPNTRADYITITRESLDRKWGGRLAAKDLERGASIIAGMRGQAGKADETLPKGLDQELLAEGGKAGAWPANAKKLNDAQKQRFYLMQQDLLEEQSRLRKNGVSPEDVRKQLKARAAEKWFSKVTVKGSGYIWDDEVPAVRAAADEQYSGKEAVPVPVSRAIPVERRNYYSTSLEAAGLPRSPAWIEWAHKQSLGVPDAQNPVPEQVKPQTAQERKAAAFDAAALEVGGPK